MTFLQSLDAYFDAVAVKIAAIKASINLNGNPSFAGGVRRSIFQGTLYDASTSGYSTGDIPSVFLGTNTNVYFHFKIPLKTTVNSEMFLFFIKGYSFGTAKVVDESIAGYSYVPNNALLNVAVKGGFSPTVYKDASNNVVLRLLLPSCYYTTIQIDAMSVGNGRYFNAGDLVCVPSLSATLDFG